MGAGLRGTSGGIGFEAVSDTPVPRQSGIFAKAHSGAAHLDALVERCRSGDRRAEVELIERLMPPLRRFLAGQADARWDRDDVLQESFVALLRALHAFRGESSVLHFAIQITKRVLGSERRARKRTRNVEALAQQLELPLVAPPSSPYAQALSTRRRGELRNFLEALPTPQAEAVILRFLEGRSVAEVSALTGAPLSTVRTRLRRAQVRLRKLLHADARLLNLFAFD